MSRRGIRFATLIAVAAACQLGCDSSSPSSPSRALHASFVPAITEMTAVPGSVYLRFAGVRTVAGAPAIFIDVMVNDASLPRGGPASVAFGAFFESVGQAGIAMGVGRGVARPRSVPFGFSNCALVVGSARDTNDEPAFATGSGWAGLVS